MSNSWDERGKAKENEYFERLNREALLRLQARSTGPKRKSPVNGQDMEQVTIQGLVLDRCSSGGVFFDKEEVERMLAELKQSGDGKAWVQKLLEDVLKT